MTTTSPPSRRGLLDPRRKTERIDRLAELAAAPDGGRGASLWVEAWRRLRRNPSAIVGAVILGIFVLIALIGPFIAPYDPTDTVGLEEIRPGTIPGPSAEYWLGLDHLGRDEYSRMLVGARQTLLVGVVATLIGVTVGSLLGGVAGAAYGLGGRWGRRVDNVLMRIVDMMLAVPGLLLAITVAAVLGPSLTTVMISVGAVAVPVFARLLRGAMIAHAGSEYVVAATALGVRKRQIALAHILPNSLAPVLVQMTLTLATAIIEAAALSFLGLGNPDIATAEWGKMLAEAQKQLEIYPGLAIYPAVGIIITAFGFTLLGEAMREALDPKLRS
jgi:peptide/nickel transport system permease protein